MIKISKFKINLFAFLRLRPDLAATQRVRMIINTILTIICFALFIVLFWLIFKITIAHMTFTKIDLNYDGLYTYKDQLLGYFGFGGGLVLDFINAFITAEGTYFEIENLIEYNFGNIFKGALFYYGVIIPFIFWIGKSIIISLTTR